MRDSGREGVLKLHPGAGSTQRIVTKKSKTIGWLLAYNDEATDLLVSHPHRAFAGSYKNAALMALVSRSGIITTNMDIAIIVDPNSVSAQGCFIPNSPVRGWMYISPYTCTMQVFRTCMNCSLDLVVSVTKDLSDSPTFWVNTASVVTFHRPAVAPITTQKLQMLFDSASIVWHFAFTFDCPRCGSPFDMELTPLRLTGMVVSCRASAKATPVRNPQKWAFPLEVQWALWRFQQNLPFRYVFDNQCLTAQGMLDYHRAKYGAIESRALSDVWGMERQDMAALTIRGQAEWQNAFPCYRRRAQPIDASDYLVCGNKRQCEEDRYTPPRATKRRATDDETSRWNEEVLGSDDSGWTSDDGSYSESSGSNTENATDTEEELESDGADVETD